MPIRQKIFAILISIGLLIFIVELVRRRKLREEYSWLWLLTGFMILILASWYDLLNYIATFIGAALPTSVLFFFSLVFLFLIAVQFSIRISKLTNQIKNLAQEIALLRDRIKKLEQDTSKDDSGFYQSPNPQSPIPNPPSESGVQEE